MTHAASTGTVDNKIFFCVDGPTLADLAVYDFLGSPFTGRKALILSQGKVHV